MATTSHKGGISFGLVYIPTALHAATKFPSICFTANMAAASSKSASVPFAAKKYQTTSW